MAAIGSQVSVGTSATLLFQCVDEDTYKANGYTRAANPEIFIAGSSGDPTPFLISLPAGTMFLGGAGVTSSSTGIGCAIIGPYTFAYNSVGGDNLYGIVASSTATVSVLAMRQ